MTFSERMHGRINKGIETSKDIASRARDQAQAWGEMGVLKIEILQLRSQAEKLVSRLGAHTYAELVERSKPSLLATDPVTASILRSIREAEAAIAEKEAAYRKTGGKELDLED